MSNKKIWEYLFEIGSYSGCHQLPERSFFYKGHQFPVCARCCGVLIGELLSIITPSRICKKTIIKCLFFDLLMFIDWFIQFIGVKESNNKRRLISGILGGYGAWKLYIIGIKKIINVLKNITVQNNSAR